MAYNSGYWEELEGSLRKQLAEALAENAALVAEFQRLADEPPTLEEIAADLDKIEMLGKELAEARAEIEQLKSRNNASVSAHMWLIMRHAFTSGAYKGYAHGTEHKLLEQMFKEWCSKDYPEAAEKEVERLTEIERKDKLIEQLKKALESAKQQHYVNDDDNWYSCPASGLCSNDSAGTDCNCGADYVNSIIEAALSAAERGE